MKMTQIAKVRMQRRPRSWTATTKETRVPHIYFADDREGERIETGVAVAVDSERRSAVVQNNAEDEKQ